VKDHKYTIKTLEELSNAQKNQEGAENDKRLAEFINVVISGEKMASKLILPLRYSGQQL